MLRRWRNKRVFFERKDTANIPPDGSLLTHADGDETKKKTSSEGECEKSEKK